MSKFNKIIFLIAVISAPITGAMAPTQNTHVQELRPDTEGIFKRMLVTLTEDDWAQLGIRFEQGKEKPWDNPETMELWLQNALDQWQSQDDNKIILRLTPDQKKVAGFAAYIINKKAPEWAGASECDIFVHWLAVSSAHRKQGHGKCLLEKLKQNLPTGGKLGLAVYKDNSGAQSLYCACGLIDKSASADQAVRWMEYNQPTS